MIVKVEGDDPDSVTDLTMGEEGSGPAMYSSLYNALDMIHSVFLKNFK